MEKELQTSLYPVTNEGSVIVLPPHDVYQYYNQEQFDAAMNAEMYPGEEYMAADDETIDEFHDKEFEENFKNLVNRLNQNLKEFNMDD